MAITANPALAVEHIRRMRGGSQSRLLRCDDGECYVVKLQNNPQGTRVLANELLAVALAKQLGLPTIEYRVVRVDEGLISQNHGDMYFELIDGRAPMVGGLCFGSRFQRSQAWSKGPELRAADCLRREDLLNLQNLSDFVGMLVFDKWTSNLDTRQAVFVFSDDSCRAKMIDNAWCFGGCQWDFFARPKEGLYFPPVVYGGVRSLETFEPWLERLNGLDQTVLLDAGAEIPAEWYEGDSKALQTLLERLWRRRKKVPQELQGVCRAYPQFFPNWNRRAMVAGASR